MGKTQRHDAEQQLQLPFNTPDDLRVALRSIDWRLAGFKSERRFDQVVELLMAVKVCGRNDGCRAHVAALLHVANQNRDGRPLIITSVRRFFEVAAEARDRGLLVSQDNWAGGKRAPSDREINEARIAELVDATRELR